MEIELFTSVKDRSKHSVQSVNRVIEWATTNQTLLNNTTAFKQFLASNPNATKQEKSSKKTQLFPAVTFSGTFSGTGKASDIIKLSGLIVLDIDHIPNIEEVREKLINDKYTYLVFTSPSGDGLKVVIKHNLIKPDEWKNLYNEIQQYYLISYNISIDESGKDISRMCFMPHMADLYKNEGSTIWNYQGNYIEKAKAIKTPIETAIRPLESSTNEDNDLYLECFYLSSYLFKHNIDITYNYDDWVKYCFALCELGEQGKEIFHNISCISEKYNKDICDYQFEYSLDIYDCDRIGIEFFLSNAKNAIVQYNLVKEFNVRF